MHLLSGYRSTASPTPSVSQALLPAQRLDDGLGVTVRYTTDKATLCPQAQLEWEAQCLRQLPAEDFGELVELGPVEHGYRLVTTRIPGTPLSELIADAPLPLADFLQLACLITRHLATLHAHHITHTSLQPDHILVDPKHTRIQLLAVGSYPWLPPPAHPLLRCDPAHWPFLAPEQLRNPAQPLDERSDLYALGMLLFVMLSGGRVPFESNTTKSWLRAHLALTPTRLSKLRPGLPSPLDQLIGKLLQKQRSERYQSAIGVLYDLKRIADLLDQGMSCDFPIAEEDMAIESLPLPEFWGRTQELKHFTRLLEQTEPGESATVRLVGPPGVGRSALLHRYLDLCSQHPQVAVLSDCLPTDHCMPGASLRRLLRQLHIRLSLEGADSPIRTALHAITPALATSLCAFLPELGQLLPQAELGVQPSLYLSLLQLRQALGALLRALCQDGKIPVLMVDDLQYADPASLELLAHALQNCRSHGDESGFVLVVSHLPDPSGTVKQLLNELPQTQTVTLELAGFEEANLVTALGTILHTPLNKQTTELGALLWQQTAGIPSQVIALLKELTSLRLLRRNLNGQYQWNLQEVDATLAARPSAHQGTAPDSLAPAQTRALLDRLAIHGAECDPALLCRTFSQPLAETVSLLHQLLWEQTLYLSQTGLRFTDPTQRTQLLQSISPTDAARSHGLLACQLKTTSAAPEFILAATYHLITQQTIHDAQPQHVASLANQLLHAGQCALQTVSPATALRYFALGLQYCSRDKAAMVCDALRLGQANALALSGEYEEARRIFDALSLTPGLPTRLLTQAYTSQLQMLYAQGQPAVALERGLSALKHLGLPAIDPTPAEQQSDLAFLITFDPRVLLGRRPATDPQFLGRTSVEAILSRRGYGQQSHLARHIQVELVRQAVHHGLSADIVPRLLELALHCAQIEAHSALHAYRQVAEQLWMRHPCRSHQLHYEFLLHVLLAPYCQLQAPAPQTLGDLPHQALDKGQPDTAMRVAGHLGLLHFLTGTHLNDLRRWVEMKLDRLRAQDRLQALPATIWLLRSTDLLQGSHPVGSSTHGVADYLDFPALQAQLQDHHVAVAAACVPLTCSLLGEHTLACDVGKACLAVSPRVPALPFKTLSALGLGFALVRQQRLAGRPSKPELLAQCMTELRAAVNRSPNQYAGLLALLEGESALAQGELDLAQSHLDGAWDAVVARQHEHFTGIVDETLGELYLAKGLLVRASQHLRSAQNHYQRWGARALALAIERKHGLILSQALLPPPGGAALAATNLSRNTSGDLNACIQIATNMQGPSNPVAAMQHVLSVAVRTLDAHSGTLLLQHSQGLVVEAIAHADGSFERISIPAECYPTLPKHLIRDVQAKRRILRVTNPGHQTPRATLGIPLVHDKESIGLLVLEHQTAHHAFAHHQDALIQYIGLQAASALDNALVHAALKETNTELEARVEQRTAELQLANDVAEQSRRAAVQATRAKSEFLASMSHELRTPLNGVLGMAQLLQQTNLNAEQREYTKTIRESTHALLSIISDILDISKIETGSLELEATEFCLLDCLESIQELLSPAAQEKHLELSAVVEPNMPEWCIGDSNRLRQALINLISNGIKFTERGDVSVLVSQLPPQAPDELHLQIAVADTGIGIAPARIEQLFEQFTQGDGSHSRRFGGTGLGLAIARRIAENMGGTVAATSQPGVGSTFLLTARLGRSERPQEAPLPNADKLNCVIHDSNDHCYQALHSQLVGLGVKHISRAPYLIKALETLAGADSHSTSTARTVLFGRHPLDEGSQAHLQSTPLPAGVALVLVCPARQRHAALASAGNQELVYALNLPLRRLPLRNIIAKCLGVARPTTIPPASATPVAPEVDRSAFRILVVEDNRINQLLALRMLKKLGYAADLAHDGRHGLTRILEEGPWHLVLMDCQMPNLDGFQATQRVREHERTHGGHVPIVALTANAMKGDREACLAAGMDDYLSKPLDLQALGSTLERHLFELQTSSAQQLGLVPGPATGTDLS